MQQKAFQKPRLKLNCEAEQPWSEEEGEQGRPLHKAPGSVTQIHFGKEAGWQERNSRMNSSEKFHVSGEL